MAAHFATNYLAHGELREPYAHWNDWYFYSYESNGKRRDSYWKNPQGIDRGEPLGGELRLSHARRAPRHFFAYAALAAVGLGHRLLAGQAAIAASWPAASRQLSLVVYGVLSDASRRSIATTAA